MTLRKRIRALLADMPGLTSYDFDGTLTVARVSLTMDTTSGPVGKIEDRVNVRGNAGDSLAITISSTFTEDNGIVMMDQTKDMVLIPTEKVERYEDLLHELRYAVSLRGVLEDEFGEERAAEICAAIERDEERRREEERHPEAMESARLSLPRSRTLSTKTNRLALGKNLNGGSLIRSASPSHGLPGTARRTTARTEGTRAGLSGAPPAQGG